MSSNDDTFTLCILANSSDYRYELKPPINLRDEGRYTTNFNRDVVQSSVIKWEAALSSVSFVYNIPNLPDTSLTYVVDGDDFVVNVPAGMYSILTLNSLIREELHVNGHFDPSTGRYFIVLEPFLPSTKSKLIVESEVDSITFSPELSTILGFVNDTFVAGRHLSDVPPVFNANVDIVQVRCPDLITRSSYVNNDVQPVLYSFNPNGRASEEIVVVPGEKIWYEITSAMPISSLNVLLTNSFGRPLPMAQGIIKYVIVIRKRVFAV